MRTSHLEKGKDTYTLLTLCTHHQTESLPFILLASLSGLLPSPSNFSLGLFEKQALGEGGSESKTGRDESDVTHLHLSFLRQPSLFGDRRCCCDDTFKHANDVGLAVQEKKEKR